MLVHKAAPTSTTVFKKFATNLHTDGTLRAARARS
jgi:hypothetical protein